MASISSYLTKIMSAIYGEEVRSSIHDAIYMINKESEQAVSDASTAKDSAIGSATAAEQSAAIAYQSAQSAAAAKSGALAAQSAAEQARTMAEQAQSAAANSESNAAVSELNAEQYAQKAQKALDSVDDVLMIKKSLEKNHAIYQDLTDSDGDNLLDSNGNQIQGRVLFADASDIVSLQKTVSVLESSLQWLFALMLDARITTLQEHALLDDTFN